MHLFTMPMNIQRGFLAGPRNDRGFDGARASVLIIVMVTLVFTAFALVAFMDRATNDLLVDHRDARAKRLRIEAYSALETTLAVLEDFRLANNGLHSPAEGWSDPLGFAGYTPAEGRTIDVAFEDESGKISLPRADAQVLSRLFVSWDVPQLDADALADALMGWMKRDHIYSTPINPDYDRGELPYEPPARPLRSFQELAAIEKVREFFYDEAGRPNEYWRRFAASVSLLDFEKPNINGATDATLGALGQYDANQLDLINRRRNGEDSLFGGTQGRVIKDTNELAAIAGQGGNAAAFSTLISALRIVITVNEGKSNFRLAAVVTTPSGGARAVYERAQRKETSTATAKRTNEQQAAPDPTRAAQRAATSKEGQKEKPNLKYPFTLLEIRENDEISAPSLPAAPPV